MKFNLNVAKVNVTFNPRIDANEPTNGCEWTQTAG